jgi:hypothetical protein
MQTRGGGHARVAAGAVNCASSEAVQLPIDGRGIAGGLSGHEAKHRKQELRRPRERNARVDEGHTMTGAEAMSSDKALARK